MSRPEISRDEQELHQREDRQQEDEDEQQVGQDVDEGRPVFRPAASRRRARSAMLLTCRGLERAAISSRAAAASRAAARTGSRPSCAPPAARSACAGRGPGCLRRDWPWRWWRAASSRRRRRCGCAALLDRARQALDRDAEVLGGGAAAAFDQLRVEVGDRRQPVLEVVVEHVLRLAGLEVEEAEDQRAGEAEQRGREGGAHAAERLGEAGLRSSKMTPVLPEETSRSWIVLGDRATPSGGGPRRCRAGRGR